jgi:beta-N-acetylhexosaminidase
LARRVLMGSFAGPVLPPWALRQVEAGLGSLCLFRSNVVSPEGLALLTAAVHDAGADVLVAVDEEGGDVTRLHADAGSPYPGNAALGVVDDPRLTEQVARSIGAELARAGVDLDLAPVVDVNSNPSNPVIGVRSFGAEPHLVARHTSAFVAGLQSAGVGACAKHFPGHGDTSLDSHVDLPTVDAPLDVLQARELVPFAAAIAAGTVAVMTSHVLLPALDPDLPASLSPSVLAVLRDELGFDGLVVADAVDMAGARAGRGEPAAAVLALDAGCDLVCLGADKDEPDHDAVIAHIVSAVESGELPETRLARAADRVVAASRAVATLRDAGAEVDDDVSADVAVSALRVVGDLSPLVGAVVLRLRTESNVAVGPVPWGLPVDGTVLAGRPMLDVVPSMTRDDVLDAVGSRPLVALVRDAHRHPWMLELLRGLAAARPDLVVVEMGLPSTGKRPLPGVAVVCTFGASRAAGQALDQVLAGRR